MAIWRLFYDDIGPWESLIFERARVRVRVRE